jgi:hypothetical protein
MLPYNRLYHPRDVQSAYENFGANCGPCALAAALRVPVARVRRLFPDFAQKPWVNPSVMWTAIALAGRKARKCGQEWPSYGLAFIQWDGPWTNRGVPPTVAYRYTHWVAVAETCDYGRMLYDVNASTTEDAAGGWVPFSWWRDEVAPAIIASIPRAINWWIRWSCEVLPAKESV